ncbi:hypothetical protein PFISCL1PPCAC_17614, partial [Pristionchus fissidentatus]
MPRPPPPPTICAAAAAVWLLAAASLLQAQQTTVNPMWTKKFTPADLPFNGLLVLPREESSHDKFGLTLLKVQPVIDEAMEEAAKRKLLPEDFWLNLTIHDSQYWKDTTLAERWSTVGVVDAYCEKRLDMILGFADSYGLATVTKVSAGFNDGIPVITTAGLPSMLHSRKSYPYLIRMQGSYRQMAAALYQLIAYKGEKTTGNDTATSSSSLNYKYMTFMYHDKKRAVNRASAEDSPDVEVASSHCYFSLYAIKNYFTEVSGTFKDIWAISTPSMPFDEEVPISRAEMKGWLKDVSEKSNVIILCASPDTVREIMLSAHELGMTKGHYVFINIDVSTGSHAERPWVRANSTSSPENDQAKEAYRALKTISLRRSDQKEYRDFEAKVRKRAEEKYAYKAMTGKDYEMNNFISAFYDAVLLYAIALNATIRDGLDPRNGHVITQKMWNKTFQGITGTVSIDANGDRYSDYSLLDLDPEKDKFVEVAFYSGKGNSLTEMGPFHWIGGKPPVDDPVCGWDFHKCPKGYPLHVYMLIGAAIIILIMGLLFIFFWRRYKLEQELAAKSWMIRWEELDGEERGKSNGKKKSKSKKSKNGDGITEGDPLLRSGSRTTLTSDKRSSSSGATRKISAMIDRKLSIFTRKKSSPNAASNMEKGNGGPSFGTNHIGELKETSDGEISPVNEVSFQLPFADGERRRKVSISSPQLSSSPDYTNKKSSNEEEEGYPSKRSIIGAMMMRRKSARKLSFGEVTSLKSHGGGSIETIAMQQGGQVYTKTACYKGTIVAIKMLSLDPKKYPKLDLTRQHLMDFKRMKDLQHDHVTRFTGACVDPPNYCIVTEYCSKGSLEDILEN